MRICLFQIALCLSLSGTSIAAQKPDSLRFQRSISSLATFVTSDNFSNTYLISPENAIVKFDSTGRQQAVFSNNRLGEANFIDASNPLKILVWYPDFQTVLLLDRTLSEMGRLNFTNAGLYSVRCVAMAFDGNIWAFDDAVSKAVKLSLEGTLLLESPPLNVYTSKRFSPSRIRDSGRLVYLNDPSGGICTLDQYGKLENLYSTLKMDDFETEGDWLFYLEKERLCLQNLSHLQLLHLPLPVAATENKPKAWLSKQGVYIQRNGLLELHTWK